MKTIKPEITMYRQAWSPMYEQYVNIIWVSDDKQGNALFKATIEGHADPILFRERELSSFTL